MYCSLVQLLKLYQLNIDRALVLFIGLTILYCKN